MIREKILTYLYNIAFWLMAVFTTIVLLIHLLELTAIIKPDGFKDYHFPMDIAFWYCSEETYLGTTILLSLVEFQALISGAAFYYFKKRFLSLFVICFPILWSGYYWSNL